MDTSIISICFTGLNQLYHTSNATNITSLKNSFFNDLYTQIYNHLSKNDSQLDKNIFLNEISSTMENLSSNDKGELSKDRVEKEIISTFKSFFLRKEWTFHSEIEKLLLNESFLNDHQLLHYIGDYLQEFKDNNYKLILFYSNILDFYVEYIILQALKLENYFTFLLDSELQKRVTFLPKQFIILSESARVLVEFQKLGAWTGLLVTLVLSYVDLKGPYYDLVQKNIEIINQGFMPDFTATTFFQQKYLIQLITCLNLKFEGSTCNQSKLEESLSNKLIVFTAIRTSFKYSDYKKHRFILSNERCVFYPHVGGIEITLRKKYNVMLNRIIYQADFLNYKQLLDNMMNYVNNNKEVLLIDNLKNIEGFLLRDKMVALLSDFTKHEKIIKLNEHYNLRMEFPSSEYISLKLFLDYEGISGFMKQHNISLPIIVKFQSDNREICHQMVLIISENGLRNIPEFILNFDIEKTFCVIQRYANHGGQVMKLYRFNNGSKTYFRPSIADMFSNYEEKYEEFQRGYFKFRTEDLLSKRILELWKKFESPVKIESLVNQDYLNEVSHVFESFVDKTLFGLDFLYDYENKIYLIIDCNNFPGYKEREKVFWKDLTEHIIFYFSKHKAN